MDMNGLNQGGYLNSLYSGYSNEMQGTGKSDKANAAQKEQSTSKLKNVSGRTIGEPKLSEKAAKYYEKLKKKYSNMEFILVSPDKKEEAERNKGMYKSAKDLLVLIDSDKIEKMAEDEAYREKYEGILNGATAKAMQMKNDLGTNANSVRSVGMTFDEKGNASYFAVVDKSLSAQRDRIESKREERVKEKKEAQKKDEKKRAEKQAEEKKTGTQKEELVTVTANSWEQLLKKIDAEVSGASNGILTDAEKKVGQKIDYVI